MPKCKAQRHSGVIWKFYKGQRDKLEAHVQQTEKVKFPENLQPSSDAPKGRIREVGAHGLAFAKPMLYVPRLSEII